MNVNINDKELIKLYEKGQSRKLKLPQEVVDKFFACIQKIDAANTIHDLWKDVSLNFKKLQGYKNRYSMRLTQKWRLEMEIDWENDELTIGSFTIIDISNHYD
jgi:toxin HigB-1